MTRGSTAVLTRPADTAPPATHAGGSMPVLRRARRWRRALPPLAFLAPMVLTLLAVSMYPVIRTIWLAFRNTSLQAQEDRFTGLRNVRRLQHDAIFWKA